MMTNLLPGKGLRSKRSFKNIAALVIFIVACICYKPAVAQNALNTLGLDNGTPATGAYSLRLLSAAYTGPLLRVNINGSYYDVYPDASAAGVLSSSSLLSAPYVNYNDAKTGATANTFGTILGSNDAFVAIWYDQSGSGNDEVQSDPNYQPYIAVSGQLSTSNGLPAMMFGGRFLRAVLPSLDPATPHTLIGVASATSGNIVALSSTPAGYQNSCLGSARSGQTASWFGGYFEDSYYETGANTAALSIRSKTYTSADSTIRGYFNGSYVYAINPAIAFNNITYNPYNLTTPDILIGYQCAFTSGTQVVGEFQPLSGSASEVLVFTTALNTAARQAVESNESAYYGVSYTADAPPGPTTVSPLTLDKAGLGSGVEATGAYSVRRLSSAYTGPLARLATFSIYGYAPSYYDVYPDAVTGAITSSSPISPVGSAPDAVAHVSTGGTLNDLMQTGATYRVEKWYDQSGNGNDVLNYYQYWQPILINGGALVTNPGGSPAFSFSNGARLVGLLPSLNPATAHTLNGVAAGYTGDIITLSSSQATGENSAVGISNTFNTAGAYGGWGEAGFGGGTGTSALGIRSKVYTPGSINGYFNGADIFVNNTTTYNLTTPDILIGAESSISQFLNGTLSEAFAFTSALSDADLKALEKNQTNFYNIGTTKADTLLLSGATNPTNAADINYTLTFEETVTGLTAGNFSLSASGGVTGAIIGTPVTADGGLNWTIPVNTGSGDGPLTLSLSNTQNLSMGLSNSLPLVADTVTIDKTAPTVVISAPSVASIGNNGTGTVSYTITYADANFNTSNLTGTGITLNNPAGTATGTVTVTGSGTSYMVTISNISGTGTLGISLAGGYASDLAGNTDAGAGASATFNVSSSDALLASIKLTPAANMTGTGSGATFVNYAATVANTTSSVTVTATVQDATATIQVNGVTTASGAASASIPLAVGSNTITTIVTAQDGATIKTYTITVTRLGNASLTSIKLSPAANMTGTGSGATFVNYAATVPNTTSSVTVTATVQDVTATIKVNGVTTASGTASAGIPLSVGSNTITTVVTAADGATKTYTITVTRMGSGNALLASLKSTPALNLKGTGSGATFVNYAATVPNTTGSVTVTATVQDVTATIKVNGATTASGVASASIPLAVGSNTITTVVTAQDGTTKTYTITVTRLANALLTSIKLSPASNLTGTGSGATLVNYSATVPNITSSVKVIATAEDAAAIIEVNGATTASGVASASIPLAVGSNTITTVVTAQDGTTTKTYTITATRAAPQGANNVYGPISVTKPTDKVTLEDGITVHQGVSPNGDGINDFLTIDGIANHPENQLTVMDRNGIMVYQTKGYDNSTRLFDGHSNLNGRMQLPGTYFYSLDYTVNGENRHKTGFIVLKY